jgi:hypothetical protein
MHIKITVRLSIIEQTAVAVMLLIVFGRCQVRVSARTLAILIEVFCGFTQSLQATA